MPEFAELVRTERERRGVRGYELARHIGVAPSWVSRLEAGEMSNPPTPEHLRGIAEFLDVPESRLLASLGYRVMETTPAYDHDAETIARAVRNWTPAQKKLLWDFVKVVTASLDASDPPDDDDASESATGD